MKFHSSLSKALARSNLTRKARCFQSKMGNSAGFQFQHEKEDPIIHLLETSTRRNWIKSFTAVPSKHKGQRQAVRPVSMASVYTVSNMATSSRLGYKDEWNILHSAAFHFTNSKAK
jgi:hypothetical protein